MNDLPDRFGFRDFIARLFDESEEIDRMVFGQRGHPRSLVIPLETLQHSSVTGYHFCGMATLARDLPIIFPTINDVRYECGESYLLWAKGFEQFVGQHLGKVRVDGWGDRDFLNFLSLLATCLVRLRVLLHPEWFPSARLRTGETMKKRKGELYGDLLPELERMRQFRKEAEGVEKAGWNEYFCDGYWTKRLVHAAALRGLSREDSLQYLITD